MSIRSGPRDTAAGPTRWTGWVTIGSGIIDTPAAVSSGPDRIDVFALGANGQLLHKRFGPVRTS
jgi:hypothetical protein